MIIKHIEEIKTKEGARQRAIDWQQWQSNQSLSYAEITKWQVLFYKIAKKFNLVREFKENCII